jgi:hypothetical protein
MGVDSMTVTMNLHWKVVKGAIEETMISYLLLPLTVNKPVAKKRHTESLDDEPEKVVFFIVINSFSI